MGPNLKCFFMKKLLFIIVLFASCYNIQQEKFDKVAWSESEDPAFPPSHRKNMIKDITSNYKLIGIKYNDLVRLLGVPNFRNSGIIGYDVDIDYGSDIDPVYIKNLLFTFSKDSVITSFKIHEWKKK
jgi:hypothetical protein